MPPMVCLHKATDRLTYVPLITSLVFHPPPGRPLTLLTYCSVVDVFDGGSLPSTSELSSAVSRYAPTVPLE